MTLRRHPLLFAGVSLVLLVAYLAATLGVLPAPGVVAGWLGGSVAERYPCENCGCGCTGARECWTHCCCHSEHERLVWAIENGVMPPPVVEFSERQWIAAANAVRPGSAVCGACVERLKADLSRGVALAPAAGRSTAKSACCGAASGGDGAHSACVATDCSSCGPETAGSSGGLPNRWAGPSMSGLACKGVKQLVTLSLPPAPQASAFLFELPTAEPITRTWAAEPAWRSRPLETPEPPPRAPCPAA